MNDVNQTIKTISVRVRRSVDYDPQNSYYFS